MKNKNAILVPSDSKVKLFEQTTADSAVKE
jgi:hypothetical protein